MDFDMPDRRQPEPEQQQHRVETHQLWSRSVLFLVLQVANIFGLAAVLAIAFYVGIWMGGVNQQLADFKGFKDAGDRYPLQRGEAVEARMDKLEALHSNDVRSLRKEWVEELREIRRMIQDRHDKL